MGKYDENTPLGTLLDDPEAKAVFDRIAGDLMNNPMIGMAQKMSFSKILGFSAGRITPEQAADLKSEILAL
jgi:hypothetical protein